MERSFVIRNYFKEQRPFVHQPEAVCALSAYEGFMDRPPSAPRKVGARAVSLAQQEGLRSLRVCGGS